MIRRHYTSEFPGGDWLAAAFAYYRRAGDDSDAARAVGGFLVQLVQDPQRYGEMTSLALGVATLQHSLPWQAQIAIQRRIDGYLRKHVGRVDPRVEQPERPMSELEQVLHMRNLGSTFLNLAETLIETESSLEWARSLDGAEMLDYVLESGSRPPRAADIRDLRRITNGPSFEVRAVTAEPFEQISLWRGRNETAIAALLVTEDAYRTVMLSGSPAEMFAAMTKLLETASLCRLALDARTSVLVPGPDNEEPRGGQAAGLLGRLLYHQGVVRLEGVSPPHHGVYVGSLQDLRPDEPTALITDTPLSVVEQVKTLHSSV